VIDPNVEIVNSDKAHDGYKVQYPMNLEQTFRRYDKFMFQVAF